DFYKFASAKGLNVKLVKVQGAAHLDLDMTDTSVEAIIELLED
ncbi:MAG: alpha/beta hydrolase, partial [Campylobacteraceae bacterium]|nr:alpha/beta hydrolase [Campylobacteraceae bacterium]